MKLVRQRIALALGLLAGLWAGSGCAKAPPSAGIRSKPVSAVGPTTGGAGASIERLGQECGFSELLLPFGGVEGPGEAGDLRNALTRSHEALSRQQAQPFAPLEAFLAQHPKSPWRGTLRLNLGLSYRQHGYAQRSLASLKDAWENLKPMTDTRAQDLANNALGEYCLGLAYLGRCKDLGLALQEAKKRQLHGASTELITNATESMEQMIRHPDRSFRCGPLALAKLVKSYRFANSQDVEKANRLIEQCFSTSRGTSLAQVSALAKSCKMSYQLAYRSPGAPLLTQAVVHWKAGHFGALLEKKRDRYLVEDSTSLATPLYVTAAALEEEVSGYFLVPAGPLPQGWRAVQVAEAQKVWGCGAPPDVDTKSTTDDDQMALDDICPTGMARWNAHALLAGLTIKDTPVGLSPAQFAQPFTVTYAHREISQPAVFSYSNLGSKWNFNYLSYINDNIVQQGRVEVYRPGGGSEWLRLPLREWTSEIGQVSGCYVKWDDPTQSFVMYYRDGSRWIYGKSVGTRYFLTKMIDPQGNMTSIVFDDQMRVTSVVDPSNRSMTFGYELASDPLKITKVTDPFGRSATFTYSGGRLSSVTDVAGLTSSFQYGANDFIQGLTTPYGTTSFTYADKSTDATLEERRILTATDPAGRNFRVEYRNFAPGMPFQESVVPQGMSVNNSYIHSRNSFTWSPNQLAGAELDYTKANIIHFLHSKDGPGTGRLPESTKKPLERRVWFRYLGQTVNTYEGFQGPFVTEVGRVHSDGTTQLSTFKYNEQFNRTEYKDPAGRVFTYGYDPNGIDLTSVTTSGKTLMAATYDTKHNIVSLTGASGGTSLFSYDGRGLVQSATNSLNQLTSYTYTPQGNLASIQEPLQKTTTFSYDSAERVSSATDSEGYTVVATHDAMDRPLAVTYPDGTKDTITYSRLDVDSTTDRLGRKVSMTHDAVQRLTQIQDPNGGSTVLGYGTQDSPNSLTDPRGNATTFAFDLQDRMVAKQYPGGASQSVVYEQCLGRVYSVTDALGKSKVFKYFVDNQLKTIDYSGTTPDVNFTADTFLPRPLSMTDGTGTTTMTYGAVGAPGANQVASINGPYGDSATFQYDVAGRPTGQTVNGSAENVTYDDLRRPTSTTNALDTFDMEYLGKTGQVTGVNSTLGPSTTYAYAPNAGDRRLTQIKNLGRAGDALSTFDYQYDAVGQITKLTETVGAGNTTGGGGGDDPCHKKCCHAGKCCKKNKCCKKKCCKGKKDCGRDRCNERHRGHDDDDDDYGMLFPMDPKVLNGLIAFSVTSLWAGLLWQFARRPRTSTSRLAQVTSLALISALALNGCIFGGGGGEETGEVTVYDFTYDRLGQLVGVDLNQVAQERYQFDPSGNLTSLTIGNTTTSFAANNLNQQTAPGTHTYDAKGQKTVLDGKTFEWDDQGRVTAIVQGTNRSEFAYDGMSRRTKITELSNGTVTSKKLYFWLGGTIVCERDGLVSGFPITKQYFGQGEVRGATKLYYAMDHLGSIRELVDSAGTVQAEYRYSTYGERTKTSGNLESDWGYAGLWHHQASGLDLATYRLYDAANKRWISRDPLGEGVDYNLYRYCGNNPINWRDPAGLDRHLEYFTLFEQGITQDGDSIYFNWDLRLSTSNGEDSLGGASLIHTLYVPSAKGWVKVGTDRQETGPMKNREVRRLKFQIKPWACDGIPKAIAIKVITELDGGKKTYSRESEYTIELGLKYRAYRVQNDRTIPEIWQDSWRIDRNSRN